ncbi:MAG TPA: cupredoxin domain-containing protein [Candidatus Saccharimonadales bacterium]|nr:cupredoxin domain-containing protein [Candidatus Saccharimonadales bacterium]
MARRAPTLLGLSSALVLILAACGGGGSSAASAGGATAAGSAPAAAACAPAAGAGTVAVTIAGQAFDPGTVAARVGDVITFTNQDAVPHTATLDDDGCTTDDIATDGTGSLTFGAAGTYPFHCAIHPAMKGTFEITS